MALASWSMVLARRQTRSFSTTDGYWRWLCLNRPVKSYFFRAIKKSTLSQSQKASGLFEPLDPHALAPAMSYRLAGEKHLPGSHGKGIPKYIPFPRQDLPQGYKIQHADSLSLSEWALYCRQVLDKDLANYGAILFRGLPLYDGDLFSAFVNKLGFTPMGYEAGAAYRPSFDSSAFTFISTLMDKAFHIEPHSDMAYLHDFPHKVVFYCDIPAGEGCGGLTPVTLGTDVLKSLHPKVAQKFEEKQIRYYFYLPTEGQGYLPWQVSFRTNDRKEVERRLDKMGVTYKWKDDGALSYWLTKEAIIYHPITGEKVWHNQADTHHNSYLKSTPMLQGVEYKSDFHYPNHTTYGDGTLIEIDVLEHIRATKWQCSVGVQLKKTDLIVFDNIKAMHGRLSYTGDRRILVFMTAD